jgi:hypothetical protein
MSSTGTTNVILQTVPFSYGFSTAIIAPTLSDWRLWLNENTTARSYWRKTWWVPPAPKASTVQLNNQCSTGGSGGTSRSAQRNNGQCLYRAVSVKQRATTSRLISHPCVLLHSTDWYRCAAHRKGARVQVWLSTFEGRQVTVHCVQGGPKRLHRGLRIAAIGLIRGIGSSGGSFVPPGGPIVSTRLQAGAHCLEARFHRLTLFQNISRSNAISDAFAQAFSNAGSSIRSGLR